MHETGSKFLFDQNSQGNFKFDDQLSISPFNTRFLNAGFDQNTGRYVSNGVDEGNNYFMR